MMTNGDPGHEACQVMTNGDPEGRHEACRVMTKGDPEGQISLSCLHMNNH